MFWDLFLKAKTIYLWGEKEPAKKNFISALKLLKSDILGNIYIILIYILCVRK